MLNYLIGMGSDVIIGIFKVFGGVTDGLSDPDEVLDPRIGTDRLTKECLVCSE
jgi:hypothetical protein